MDCLTLSKIHRAIFCQWSLLKPLLIDFEVVSNCMISHKLCSFHIFKTLRWIRKNSWSTNFVSPNNYFGCKIITFDYQSCPCSKDKITLHFLNFLKHFTFNVVYLMNFTPRQKGNWVWPPHRIIPCNEEVEIRKTVYSEFWVQGIWKINIWPQSTELKIANFLAFRLSGHFVPHQSLVQSEDQGLRPETNSIQQIRNVKFSS